MNELLRDKHAREYLGVSQSTLWRWTREGKLKSFKLGVRVTVWAKADLDAFIASRMAVAS